MGEPPTREPSWYHSTAVIVVALLLCFPIGLFCVWTHPRYTQKTKLVITGVVAVFVVIGAIADANDEDDAADLTTDRTAVEDDTADPTTSTTRRRTTTTSTSTSASTSTTEAPTTTLRPSTLPPPENVVLSAAGQQATAPLRLDGGHYIVHFRFRGDCFYGAALQSTSPDDFVYEDLGTGMGPIEGDTNIYGIEAGEYYVDMITGPAPDCPWDIVLTAAP